MHGPEVGDRSKPVHLSGQDPPFRRDKSLTAVLQLFLLRSGLFLTQNRVNICLQSPAVDFTRAISRSIKQTRASERRPIKERLQKPLIKTAIYKDVSEHRKGWRQRRGQNIQKFKRRQVAAASVQHLSRWMPGPAWHPPGGAGP